MKDNYKALTYESVLEDRQKFIQAGTRNGSDFNFFDTTVTKYFKILFYFENKDSDALGNSGGLLDPTWMHIDTKTTNELSIHDYNSAYSYLWFNDEIERRNLLQKFIMLLSNINTESPWYFSELSGVGEALNRTQITNNNIMIEEQRKKITIKCLPDAFDNRIATLMDLYRSIVWSWQTKREVLPSNLRKFDMGVYIFSDPIKNFHKLDTRGLIKLFKTDDTYDYASFDIDTNELGGNYRTSYKYIEFHNCEFDYNSGTSVYDSLNNKEGIMPTFDINIFYDDCYESNYNEFLMEAMGDLIAADVISLADQERISKEKESEVNAIPLNDIINPRLLQSRIDNLEKRANVDKKGFLENAANNLIGAGTSMVNSFVKKIALGNLYSLRLSDLADLGKSVLTGDVFNTAHSVSDFLKDDKKGRSRKASHIGEMFEQPDQENPWVPGDIFVESEEPIPPTINSTNMFEKEESDQENPWIPGDIFVEEEQIENPIKEMGNIFPSTSNKMQSDVPKDKIFIREENISNFKLGNMFKAIKATTLANNL